MKKVNKRGVIQKHLILPEKNKKAFWAKEMVLLNKLLNKYPLDFLYVIEFPKKFDSLAFLWNEYYGQELQKKYDVWRVYKDKKISKTDYDFSEKPFGEPHKPKKKKTIKDFLKNG